MRGNCRADGAWREVGEAILTFVSLCLSLFFSSGSLSPMEETAVTEGEGKIRLPALSLQPAGYYSPPLPRVQTLCWKQEQQRWVFSAGSGDFPIIYCTDVCVQAGFFVPEHFCFAVGTLISGGGRLCSPC